MTACESFLEKYATFGREPTPGRYVELFDPEGTVLHPGMAAPIGVDQIPGFISRALATFRDYRLEPVRWCANAGTIFIEARNSAAVGGKRVAWPAIYCITLRGDRVLRGRAYYDRIGVLSHLDSALATGRPDAHLKVLEPGESKLRQCADGSLSAADIFERFVLPYAHYWKNADPRRFPLFYHPQGRLLNPGLERALGREEIADYYAAMKSKIPDVRCELEAWAASAGLVFLEWTATGTLGGKRFELGVADRFTLDGSLALEGVGYFDRLTLRALLDPKPVMGTVFMAVNASSADPSRA